jgi:hypothetical protein
VAGPTSLLTRATFDADLGAPLLTLDKVFAQIRAMSLFLTATPDTFFTTGTQFVPLYTAAEVATFKSAYADAEQLDQIYQGLVALAASKDFRANAKQIWGAGWQ